MQPSVVAPDLQRFIQRDISPLMIDLIIRSWSTPKHWRSLTDSPVYPRHLVVLTTDWYFDFNFFHELSAVLKNFPPKWWVNMFEHFYAEGKKLIRTSQTLAKELEHETIQKMQQGLFRYELATQDFAYCLLFTHVASLHWEKRVDQWLDSVPPTERQATKEIMTRPIKLNTISLERLAVAKLRVWQMKHPQHEDKLGKLAAQHIQDFGVLASRGDVLKRWTVNEIRHRLDLLSTEEAEKTIQTITLQEKQALADLKQLCKQYPELKQHQAEIGIVKELVYFRTYRTELLYSSFFYFWPVLEQWGSLLHMTAEDLAHLRVTELEELRGDLITRFRQLIQDRKRGFGVHLNEGQVTWSTGEEYRLLHARFSSAQTQSEWSGLPAFHGLAQGRAVVVVTKADLHKVQPGDILIAPMTNPDFVMALEKAAAFVTDEGGITCHAAIVAREMKKPCVIGTKTATRSIKDGDLVEVDATQGKVRIIRTHS